MTSPKGESKAPNSYVYKGDKAEIHDDDIADRMKADEGWYDNPDDAKKKTAKPKDVDKIPASDPETLQGDGSSTPDEDVKDASGMSFDANRHYKDKRTDDDGNFAVRKNAK